MKIALVSPLYESVPPKGYGGVERIVAYLSDEFTAQGHDVTLFATEDSKARVHRLIPGAKSGLRTLPNCSDPSIWHLVMLERVYEHARQFDVIHFHLDYLHMPLARARQWRHITTLHGRLDGDDQRKIYGEYSELPVVSISKAQRRQAPHLNWRATVYNALPLGEYTFSPKQGDYLAFLGRIAPEKGVEHAIQIAHQAGVPLHIAAKVDDTCQDYFRQTIVPLLNRSNARFLGEIGGHIKDAFLGGARGLLFPIQWPEPFGLVMIEAMACGTPVIAYPCGSVPEVIDNGVTGFVVDSIDSAVEAVGKLDYINRRACRECVEQRFSATRMAQEYLALYARTIEESALPVAGQQAMQPNLRRWKWSRRKQKMNSSKPLH